MKDYFSKKYQKWFRCGDFNRHPCMKNLYSFGKYWWRKDRDILIHNDIVGDYIVNCTTKHKRSKRDSYCIKNGIDIVD